MDAHHIQAKFAEIERSSQVLKHIIIHRQQVALKPLLGHQHCYFFILLVDSRLIIVGG